MLIKKTSKMLLSIVSKQEFVGNGTKHMTSLEIAELTGKQHKNVMQRAEISAG